jgi:hypothetical protein
MALNQFPRRSFVGSSTLQTFTGDGTTTAFTLSSAQTQNEVFLFVDDVAQVPGVDFTVSGTTLTFATAPANNAEIIARGFGVPAPVTTVSDGSVTAAKLATGAIEAKLGYTPVSPTQLSNEVAALVDSAPSALNTLNELAAALGDDANYASTITTALGTKANTSSLGTLASVSPTGTPDNTKFLRGDNSWQVVAVTPTAVSDQNNTSTGYFDLPSGTDAQRPISPAVGNIRYNTTLNMYEFYNGTYWGEVKIYPVIYQFSSHTFTTAGATGRLGPSLAQLQSSYSSTIWASNTSYLNSNNGTQIWTVPKTGNYQITVAGARGGYASNGQGDNAQTPGNGVIKRATFSLNAGDILYILVGQKGLDSPTVGPTGDSGFNSDTDAGGGGGSFVAKQGGSTYYHTNIAQYCIPLIVAGGGGAGSSDGTGRDASYNQTQDASGITSLENWGYSSGAGFSQLPDDSYISGLVARRTNRWGTTFLSGGAGGLSVSNIGQGIGGFGGGGGATDEGGAGGGGWYGGINGDNGTASQGGTSYVDADGISVSDVGTNNNNGYVEVVYLG